MFLNPKETIDALTLQITNFFLHILLALFTFYFTYFIKNYILQISTNKTIFNYYYIF